MHRSDFHSESESWKRLAAMTILLASMKLEDDIADEHSIKAQAALILFRRAANKAEFDYSEAAEVFRNGFKEMSILEKKQSDVFLLSKKFGDTLTNGLQCLFSCSKEDMVLIQHVSEWIYFIDAIDDLEKDIRKKTYNPFKPFAEKRKMLITENFDYLERFISSQMKRIRPVLSNYSEGTARGWIILSMLTNSMPYITLQIMQGKKLFAPRSGIQKRIEAKGGYWLV